jgi:triosephosphate isomerase (TIM)
MARKFFVGGNFKMNPSTIAQKKSIVDLLAKADLDSSVGA